MNDRTSREPAPHPSSTDHPNHEPDPATWPGLFHRLTHNWSSITRLVAVATVLSALAVGIVLILGLNTLHLGPLGLDRAP
ncbi:hypothetical protein ACTG9Q_31535 [Actinokineospora sp. 24-640]